MILSKNKACGFVFRFQVPLSSTTKNLLTQKRKGTWTRPFVTSIFFSKCSKILCASRARTQRPCDARRLAVEGARFRPSIPSPAFKYNKKSANADFLVLVAGLGIEPRPSGYEPDELPLLYPAMLYFTYF